MRIFNRMTKTNEPGGIFWIIFSIAGYLSIFKAHVPIDTGLLLFIIYSIELIFGIYRLYNFSIGPKSRHLNNIRDQFRIVGIQLTIISLIQLSIIMFILKSIDFKSFSFSIIFESLFCGTVFIVLSLLKKFQNDT